MKISIPSKRWSQKAFLFWVKVRSFRIAEYLWLIYDCFSFWIVSSITNAWTTGLHLIEITKTATSWFLPNFRKAILLKLNTIFLLKNLIYNETREALVLKDCCFFLIRFSKKNKQTKKQKHANAKIAYRHNYSPGILPMIK